jgi:hypothetical protein
MREVTELINVKGNPDAAAKCEKRLLELKVKLDEAADALEWPSLIAEARQMLGCLVEADKAHGNAEQPAQTSKLAVDIERLVRKERPDEDLRSKIEQVRQLRITIFTAQPDFWGVPGRLFRQRAVSTWVAARAPSRRVRQFLEARDLRRPRSRLPSQTAR